MDRHSDWTKAKLELSEASKRYATWASMPDYVRLQMPRREFNRCRSEAFKALKLADLRCEQAGEAARRANRLIDTAGMHG